MTDETNSAEASEDSLIGSCYFCQKDVFASEFTYEFWAAQPKDGGGVLKIPCHDSCTKKNFSPEKGRCGVCDREGLIVPLTKLCGPCMFGEQNMVNGEWWDEITGTAGSDDVGGPGALH